LRRAAKCTISVLDDTSFGVLVLTTSFRREQSAQDEIRQLEATTAALREQMAVLERQVATSEAEKARLAKQHRSFLDKARAQLAQTREQLRDVQRTTEQQEQQVRCGLLPVVKWLVALTCVDLWHLMQLRALKDSNDQLLAQLKIRDDGPRSPQGASSEPVASVVASNGIIQRCSSVIGGDLVGNTPAENHKLRRALREYETKLDKVEASREELRSEVQRLYKQIVGYRQSTQTQNYVKLEKEERRQNELATELKCKLAESDAELLRTRGALKERENLIQQMKDEYGKLFSALQKHKTTTSAQLLSSGKLTRIASCVNFGSGVRPAGQSAEVDTRANDLNALGTAGKARGRLQSANDHPYLVDLYRVKIEELERQVEGLQVQIRKMIASEYRHKQQNRLFRVEKKQLVDACDELRADLEKAVLTSAKSMTVTKALSMNEPSIDLSGPSNGATVSETTSGGSKTLRTSVSGTLNEVKRLRQRNQFLEERFRAVLHAAGRSSRTAASRDKSTEAEEGLEPAPESLEHERAEKSERSNNAAPNNEDAKEAEAPISLTALSRRGSSAGLREKLSVGEVDPPEVFRSIDSTMLESLQQVKRTARIRPKSAAVVSALQR
jgi:hypothetical protein